MNIQPTGVGEGGSHVQKMYRSEYSSGVLVPSADVRFEFSNAPTVGMGDVLLDVGQRSYCGSSQCIPAWQA